VRRDILAGIDVGLPSRIVPVDQLDVLEKTMVVFGDLWSVNTEGKDIYHLYTLSSYDFR
jgi:hypothetical protein